MDKHPNVPKDLIEFLNTLFPERCPEPSWSDREVWMRAGERRVVRKLIQMHEDQIKEGLKGTK